MSELTCDQRALAEYMSDLSEEAHSAGWMLDLEHALWCALEEGIYGYGRMVLLPRHVDSVRELSARCGGWIYFDDLKEETFVAFDQWLGGMYQRERGRAQLYRQRSGLPAWPKAIHDVAAVIARGML